jgi:hypothetical protein
VLRLRKAKSTIRAFFDVRAILCILPSSVRAMGNFGMENGDGTLLTQISSRFSIGSMGPRNFSIRFKPFKNSSLLVMAIATAHKTQEISSVKKIYVHSSDCAVPLNCSDASNVTPSPYLKITDPRNNLQNHRSNAFLPYSRTKILVRRAERCNPEIENGE